MARHLALRCGNRQNSLETTGRRALLQNFPDKVFHQAEPSLIQ
jgi:hypothetical protein